MALSIKTKKQKPALRQLASRMAFALVLLGNGGSLLIGASQAQDAAHIISSPTTTRFVDGVGKALNGVSIEMTEMHSYSALDWMCAETNASKPTLVLSAMAITPVLTDKCVANGINNLLEAHLGFLALVLVQKSSDLPFALTSDDVYRALARDVPFDDGFKKNTTRNWADENPELPELPIKVILQPRPGATRSIFEAGALVTGCRKYDVIQNIYDAAPRMEKCTNIRAEAIEEIDDIAARLEGLRNAEPGAVALFSAGVYEENKDWLRVVRFDGIMPNLEDIIDEDYMLSAPVYAYARPEVVSGGAPNADLRAWLLEALSENAIGDDGYLKTIGLKPLPKVTREWQRKALAE